MSKMLELSVVHSGVINSTTSPHVHHQHFVENITLQITAVFVNPVRLETNPCKVRICLRARSHSQSRAVEQVHERRGRDGRVSESRTVDRATKTKDEIIFVVFLYSDYHYSYNISNICCIFRI